MVTIRSIFGGGGGAAEGSGFVLDTSGHIVTNAHVVTDESSGSAQARQGSLRRVPRPQRRLRPTSSASTPSPTSPCSKVKPDGFALHPLKLGDDHELVVGQPVAAIGSPFGEQQSLSVGVVSATDRSVESLTKFQIEGAIQTDASINPGNSGGPLLDAGARVIGINQQIETNSGANDGVGFAVPISAIKRSIAQLEARRRSRIRLHRRLHPGALPAAGRASSASTPTTAACSPKSCPAAPPTKPACKAATASCASRPPPTDTGGDVILAVDGHKVVGPDDLARLHRRLPAGRHGDAGRPPRRQARGSRSHAGQTPATAERRRADRSGL